MMWEVLFASAGLYAATQFLLVLALAWRLDVVSKYE
jgi:hypothetical protein